MDISALLMFGLTLVVAFVIVRIGAIAFELTGINWSQALFQAISCFTGTGYTTHEAELIADHPQRRRIASTLMILGNASWVTLVVAFATYLNQRLREDAVGRVNLEWWGLHFSVPTAALQIGKMILALAIVYLLYRFFVKSWAWDRLAGVIRQHMKIRGVITPIAFEEMTVGKKGYGILKLKLSEESKLCGKSLMESGLRKDFDLQVLAIERDDEILPNPNPSEILRVNDHLLCFGRRRGNHEQLRHLI
jgi:hypothetical protein